jgi:hypothetical protein
MIVLGVSKLDEGTNKIDWGDGTIETLAPTSAGTLGDYTYGTMSHTYNANGNYDIKINGSGSILLGIKITTGSENTEGFRFGVYKPVQADGSAISGDVVNMPVRYLKIGTICKVLSCPLGRQLGLIAPPHYMQSIGCTYPNYGPYVFANGSNIGECYYNPDIIFLGMMNQVNKVLYENPSVKNDFLGGFEGDGFLLLTSVGSSFGTTKIKNYPFTSVGYIKIPSGGTVEFPSTLTSIQDGGWEWSGNATLKFYTPSGVRVNLPSGFANSKTAYSVTIYTDNEDIRNYDWAGDNITATFYHLNGTAW